MKFSKTILLAAGALTLLSACGGRRESTNQTSTFRVERVTLEGSLWDGAETAGGVSESKSFQFKACITDAASLDAIKNSRFSISDGDSEKTAVTNNSGCLLWNESHPMSATNNEKMVQFQRIFRGLDAFTGTVPVTLAMNPWGGPESFFDLHVDNSFEQQKLRLPRVDTALAFRFEADLRVGFNTPFAQTQDPDVVDVTDEKSEIILPKITLRYSGLDKSISQIDSLLTLKTAQKYELRLEPKFLRMNLQQKSILTEITSGHMNLQIILVPDGMDPEQIQAGNIGAHYSGDVDVNPDGTITSDIVIRLDDMALVLSRTRIYVVLRPLEKAASNFRVGAYTGHVGPSRTAESSFALTPVGEKRSLILEKTRIALESIDTPVRALDLFASQPGIMANTAKLPTNLNQALSELQKNRTKQSYCDLLYSSEQKAEVNGAILFWTKKKVPAREACRNDLNRFVSVSQREFVEDVLDTPTVIGDTETLQIKVSRTLKFTRSENDTRGGSVKFTGGVSADVKQDVFQFGPARGGFSLGFGAEASWVMKAERVEGKEIAGNISDEETFNVAADVYEMTVTTRTCVIVSGTSEAQGKAFYTCGEVNPSKTVQEKYYVIRQKIENSPFTDDEDAGSSKWRLSLRGEAQYKAFEKMMTSENVILNFSNQFPYPVDAKSPVLPAFRINQEFPGVLSAPLQ